MPDLANRPEENRLPAIVAWIAANPALTCILMGLTAIVLRSLLLPIIPIPKPAIHDEFSYLLGADTFASGRLTNEPHPMWVHFETFHVNPLPTYCSKYPPAQALFLALGQAVFGHPWIGVLLSMGVLFAALCWMLQGWISPAYLLLTLAAVMAEWAISSYWINSYWGGAVAAIGGAFVIGALPRLVRRVSFGPVAAATLGLLILANSRPYEGAFTAVGFFLALVFLRHRKGEPFFALFKRAAVVPFLLLVIPGAAAMAYYNFRTTGSATVFPYMVHQRMYAASPHIYVLPSGPTPVYRHEVIRELWIDWDRAVYLKAREDPLLTLKGIGTELYRSFFPPAFILATMAALVIGWGIEVGAILILIAVPLAGLLVVKAVLPHYFAPLFGAFVVLIGIGFQACGRMRLRLRGYSIGGLAVALIVGLLLQHSAWTLIAHIIGSDVPSEPIGQRDKLIVDLERQGGRHLVLVRYRPDHNFHMEWVYNRADIDASAVVWAREMSSEQNVNLLKYFRERKVWLFEPDKNTTKLTPYTPVARER